MKQPHGDETERARTMSEPIKILLVEDVPSDAELAGRVIRKAGIDFVFTRVETREEFLKSISAFKPDLILTDYRLPRFDGMSALKLAREIAPDVPVIIITGATNEETAVECMKAGATDYVIKEHVDSLGSAVKGALDLKKLRSEKKKDEKLLRENEACFSALYKLSQMSGAAEKEIIEFALEEGVRLTGSEIGYIHFFMDDRIRTDLIAWSKNVQKDCVIENDLHDSLDVAGLWADSARTGKPAIHNDYQSISGKKGYPATHINVVRHMSIPIMDDGAIVLVAGVGNKKIPYDEGDVRQLELFMDGMWKLLQKNRAEDILRRSLLEKEILLKEIHHRVKNNMQIISSMLSIQSSYSSGRDIQDIILVMQTRIRSMAIIHEELYRSGDFADIEFKICIQNITDGLLSAYAIEPSLLTIRLDCEGIRLSMDTSLPCSLIINELVSNSLKYAFPDKRAGEIVVSITMNDDHTYTLVIRDNGIGLPGDIELGKLKSMGLLLVKVLIEQLGGTIQINRNTGTEYIIRFKG
jgi:two-component sensor histidine kinase/CheY-like chemotaxis protein